MPFLDQMLDQIFDIVAFNAIAIIGSYQLFMKGYKMGAGSVEMLVNHRSTKILEALSLLGIFVMGGVAASYVNLVTGLEYITKDGVDINVQLMLNGIFPKLLPLIVVLGTWFAMAMKGQSPVKAMLSLVVLFFIGVAVFFF
ncbi:PTS system mannose/fructose/sorbose family transporter subunit IID [Photobacterium sp. J15]|uniref:PTS system mannose/fructose/sorbose family transporter subunit IID n=1 Tax=Photobacterium sp. J15 TaxID=265901 RepID=UPI000A8F3FBA|nr:PTS system mannose/fructose/sorbose family transporter subunit IID [Photobacterium sp. J15]